jgi:hypothetical protein
VEPPEVGRLVDLFRQLGARDPEGWARSQVEEGIPQLGRFLFLREAWSRIVSETDSGWLREAVARADARPSEPYAGVGQSLKSLLAKGATEREITDLVRGMQAQLLFSLCYLLEDPNIQEEQASDVCWRLFLVDEEGHPQEPLDGLHESVLETDPTGREMRPREAAG